MKLILISNPENVEGEHELINVLLDKGVDYFHLRKPGQTKKEVEAFLNLINPKYIKKVVLHAHHILVRKYNIGGFHFPSSFLQQEDHNKLLELINNARKRRMRTGISVHSLEEAADLKGFDYYFLSPVFDSISKDGYNASFDPDQLRNFYEYRKSIKDQPEAIALGGVDEKSAGILQQIGFTGAALLGAIWKDYKKENFDRVVQKFEAIKKQLNDE